MNNRLLLFKSVLTFVCCVFFASGAFAQSGSAQVPADATTTQQQNNTTNVAAFSEVTGTTGANYNNGTAPNGNTGITEPSAAYYQNLEDQVTNIEDQMAGLDPATQEYKNLDRKLKSIKEILENK